jgi:S-adenosylmethionine hydrolase
VEAGVLLATVLAVDGYGNAQLGAARGDAPFKLGDALRVAGGAAAGPGLAARYARTFADVGAGELLLYEDGAGRLALAVNTGDASARLAVRPGDDVRIGPA